MLVVQYIVIMVLELGPRVAWLVFVVMILITAATYVGRLYGGRWRSEEALARVMAEH